MARLAGGCSKTLSLLLLLLMAIIEQGQGTLYEPAPPDVTEKQIHWRENICTTTNFKFDHMLYNVSIPENSVGKTLAVQPPNDDCLGIKICPDIDVKYRIMNGDKDKIFKAEERIVGDFAFLIIRTRTNNVILNREKDDSYHLEIRATGIRKGAKEKTTYEAVVRVHVTVTDINDLSPLFYPTEYIITISEDTPLHQSILRVTAEDADLGINGEIYYSLLEETDQFSVHPTSGVITLTRPVKFAERSIHEFFVIAVDRFSSYTMNRVSLGSKARVKIKIKQVNLHSPDIYVQALSDIVENSNTNIYGIVRIADKDDGINGQVKTLEIVDGDPDGHFRIKPASKTNEFVIEVHQLLDREAAPSGYNLTLRAVDKGTPPRQSYKTIAVSLSDVNDNKPVFNREIYEVSIPEISPPNTPVIRLKVTDRDEGKNGQVFLQIVGGNEGGEFRVNPETGMLYTAVQLDYEKKKFYTLTVSAIDAGNAGTRKQSSAKVKVNIEDCNDNDPIFQKTNMTIWIDENEPAGTPVTTVIARDSDAGENSYISYSIANLNDVPFDIDHFSGTVRTSKLLDYESMRREYQLKIRASDWGLPYRRQTETQLIIKLRPVNDNRPQFERVDCVGQIPRNTPIGTEVLGLSALDSDIDSVIGYRLISGNEDGCFNLDSSSGIISIGCDLNDVGVEMRDINVTATDGTHFGDTMHIQVSLVNGKVISNKRSSNGDVSFFECRDTGVVRRLAELMAAVERNNMPGKEPTANDDFTMMPSRYGENVHSPEFVDLPVEVRVNESAPLGTTITWIKGRDRDLGYNGKLVYGISGGDNDSVFRIDAETGEIKIIGYLDREREDEYLLNITVYDLGTPQKSTSRLLPITILDENDNVPRFVKSLASVRVAESAPNGTVVQKLETIDNDIGENGHVSFSLLTDTHDFKVDPELGTLYVSNALDRERQDFYELKVRASDNGAKTGSTSLHGDAIVRVTVEDENDNVPVFVKPTGIDVLTIPLREDVPKGTVVTVVNAIDLDSGPSGEVLYSFSEDGNGDGYFRIDKFSGTIRTVKSLDFEERQIHSLNIKAVDKGLPSLSSETIIIVEIIDINENRFAPQFDDFVFIGKILENQPVGTHVLNVVAVDRDAPGPDSRISYSIRGGDGLGIFTIDDEGAIRSLLKLDLETKSHYWLTVCAQDHAVNPLHTCVQVFIQVENENDNVPLTNYSQYYSTVPENSPAGTSVVQLFGEDADIDPLQQLTYRITSGNPESFFTINSTNGVISTTARKLDRENQFEHILEVMIMDNGNPQLSSTTRVVINVDDINDNAPEFDQKFYKVQVPANAKVDQALFQVLAMDRDAGENGRVVYSIKSGRGKAKFRIDSSTGIVYAAKTFIGILPDGEPEQYDFQIRAEDCGNHKKSQSTRVNVLVRPTPEESVYEPVVITPNQHIEVTENDVPGYLVTLIQATDEDNDQLWYGIVDGDEKNEFYIGRDNGNILLAKQLDWETKNEYNLTISITDAINTIYTQLYVTVIDVNDVVPKFSKSNYVVNISENIEEGTEILQLHATDQDGEKKLFFSLHAAQDPISLKLFKVDSVSGSIVTTQMLDREQTSKHTLIVIVKDGGTPAKRDYAKVQVHVHDQNDHSPEFTSKIVEGRVYETAALGSKVVEVVATDRDIGDNARIQYSIVSGNIGNTFSMDALMGTISVAKELDMTVLTEYMLQVKATDFGKPALSSQIPVHIMVTMADNAAPRFLLTEKAAEVYEDVPIGSYVMKVEARSTSSIMFEIENGNIGDTFFINPSIGIITTKDFLDFETTKIFNLTIRATNMASTSAICHVTIHLLDINDNTPFFVQKDYKGEVQESVPIGSLITTIVEEPTHSLTNNTIGPLVIKAIDYDSGINALLHYHIVEELPRKYFHIDSSTGAIKTIMLLDHEKIPLYKFHVKVSDPHLCSESMAYVEIFVRDVNDCTPHFAQTEYNVTLLIPTYVNVVVTEVNAHDEDASTNTILRYDIVEGNRDNVFAITDPLKGIITTRDVEKIGNSYKLNVRVSDGKFSSITYVNIDVETSENSGLIFQKAIYEASIFENSTKVVTAAVVNVLGTTLNEHIEFRILNPTDMFKIGKTSGVIQTTGKRFDREIQDKYELVIEACSQSVPDREKPRIAHVMVNVTVLDVNDNCPTFVNLPYYAVVSVDDPKGSAIATVRAYDKDKGDNGEVRYEMKKGHGELFKVDRKNGEISLKQTLEGHNRDYMLTIAAYDGGIQPCSVDVTVHVKVIDKSMPVFAKQFYVDNIPENIELHSPLSVAIQAESPLGRKLIFSIVKGNEMEKFAVDFNTGAIYVVDELDYETKQNYELMIRATDSVSGISADVPVLVNIEDVNDCPPDIEMDIYNISIAEIAPFGTPILKVVAKDNDTGMNQIVHFGLQTDNKNSSEYFHIDANDGIVYLKKSLDHERLSMHHFIVIASDRGVPSLSSTAHVWVNVLDTNDNQPRFEQPSYSCGISESASRGQFVTVVSASDPDFIDHDKLVYAIVQGNDAQTYNIDAKTGIISLTNMQNFGEEHQTVLNVSVTDGVYTSFTRVKINILPENLHSPIFNVQYDVKVNENQLAGTVIATVKARDSDFGEYGRVTYALFSDEMQEYFKIDKETGAVETKIRLDREVRKLYEIPIIASDQGGRSGFTVIRLHVLDENDEKPRFDLNEIKSTIYSNLTINTTFLKIKAFDNDDGENAVIKYGIHDAQNAGIKDIFGVYESTGEVFLLKNMSSYENQMFQFFIRAHDGGTPSLHENVPVNIFIMSTSDEAPRFEKKEKALFLSEHSPPGTNIAKIEMASNMTVKLKIISDTEEDPQFTINENGDLRLAKTLDREIKDHYLIVIMAETEALPALTATTEIVLHILDENDNIPSFDSNPYLLTLSENIPPGSSILKLTAKDMDAGSNGDVRYSISNDAGDILNIFDIDPYSGWITTLVALDKEKRSDYKFHVTANDNGQPRHATRTNVIITLIDCNDNPPQFKNRIYNASISEDSLPGTVITQVAVTDRDRDLNTPYDFYIISGDSLSQFQIRQTGEVYIVKPLDRERIAYYKLKIIVTDGKYSSDTEVYVLVLDANDNQPYCLKYRYRKSVSEATPPGTYILQVVASDADLPENARLRYYLTGNGAEDFNLDKDSGDMRTTRPLDRETASKYHFIAHVQDRDHIGWECSCEISIDLLDVNDNAPLFSLGSYSVAMPENAEIGSLVTKVHATDADVGINRKLRYSFLDSHKDHFKIDPESGILTLAKTLDRETLAIYNLSVKVTDIGVPPLSSTTSLIVSISDINDNPPEFSSKHYFAIIDESSQVGAEVTQVYATSIDTGINAEISYSIVGGNEHKKFSINNETGTVFLIEPLDYERARDYFLTVQAIDHGTPPLSNLATLNVTVTDANDNSPQFGQYSYSATIREDAEIGDKILQVHAVDMDAGDNGHVAYAIEKGDRQHQFHIEEDSGYISVAGALDRETISSYVLEVIATDKGSPPLTSFVLVNIAISDANDNPPLFSETSLKNILPDLIETSQTEMTVTPSLNKTSRLHSMEPQSSHFTAFVQENKPIGHPLIKFTITDADVTPNAAPYTFDFRSGNEMGAFRIEQDGILRTATRFNHKIKDNYRVQIRVFDNGTPPLYSDAWVLIKVIEESQYPPTITPLDISINSYGDEFPGGKIGRIFAQDQDQYDVLSYVLTPTGGVLYEPTALFNISKVDGTLYAFPRLDVDNYRVNVTVSDGKFASFMIVKISVELVTEEMVKSSVMVRFSKITPEEFILSHRKGFIRSIRSLVGTRLKDIMIISVQPATTNNGNTIRYERSVGRDLDVVFAVRRYSPKANVTGFIPTSELRKTITDHLMEIEEATRLNIDDVMTTKCKPSFCVHGECTDKIVLDTSFVEAIATDVTSFVSSRHIVKAECECNVGYGGDKCELAVNECSKRPCASEKICVPDSSVQGYHCICPEGFVGPNCDKDINTCADDKCYEPKNPVSFSGKSYAQYRIDKVIAKKNLEDQLNLNLKIRTVQPTGCIMFSEGRVDYNILEIVNGVIQYRFDLGSGEGLVFVSSMFVSDGQWHEIRLEREGNSAKLTIDGNYGAQGSAPGVNGVLNLQNDDIYFGAEIRKHLGLIGSQDLQRGFIGCMDDITISKIPVPLHKTGSSSVAVLNRFVNIEFSCDTSMVLAPIGVCGTQPCFNGGTCKDIGGNRFECACHDRFSGPFCKEDLDPCASSPCLYGGKCKHEASGNYTCDCPAKMTGKRCDYGRYCLPNPCRNGGVCEESDDGPLCMCRGYMGPTCEIDVNECDRHPCGNGATCINEPGSFRCICPDEMTGASCGDPLYSNSITSKLRNVPWEYIMAGMGAIMVIISSCILLISCFFCRRKNKREHINGKNNEGVKENLVSNVSAEPYKRSSKMSNIDMAQRTDHQQRPVSYTASSNNDQGYHLQYNNLYGSAGDELEKLPNEYKKLKRPNPNINCGNTSSDNESLHKQKWNDHIQMQTFTDTKIVNDLKRASPAFDSTSSRSTVKSGILPGRLNSTPGNCNNSLPCTSSLMPPGFEDSSNTTHGAYHWDCSDWIRRSHNTLPNITEVPGSEIPDSSSFHSQESAESNHHLHPRLKNSVLPPILGPVDPARDIKTLNEAESEYVDDSECDQSEQPLTMSYVNDTISSMNQMDSGSEDYRFNTADVYLRHPNSYLPKYIQSETDCENMSLNSNLLARREINGLDIGPHQIVESDEEDIPSYGFPSQLKRRNRRGGTNNIDDMLENGGENSSLLGHHIDSNSDVSMTQLCEIDDSEYEQEPLQNQQQLKSLLNTSKNSTNSDRSKSSKKSVKWNNNVQQTDV